MPRLAILDLDGTLVDSVDDLAASVNHALVVVGLPPRPTADVRSFVGDGARMLLERAVGPRTDLVESALAAWWAHYEDHCLDRTVLYPGIAAALAGAGRTLAVHTNKPGRLARRILAGLGVLDRFAVVLGGDEAARKPDPEGARAILSRTGVAAADAVFVGDSPVDLATARAAGVAAVAVGWGLHAAAALRSAGAEVVVDDPAALARWLA
jgi:phosphoglycolate phosphatase